jgi:hypothetical protein
VKILTGEVLSHVQLQTSVSEFDIGIAQNLNGEETEGARKAYAILTGVISIVLALAYLLLVQLLDYGAR